MNKISLRDMKKEATAHALSNAAFDLARERGLDGFVVEDVVQRAGYSRRTFANHFSCMEEAVAAVVAFKNINDAEQLLADLPDNVAPIDALYQLLLTQITTGLLRKLQELVLLSKQNPTLEPYILNVFRGLQMAAQELVNDLFEGRYPEGYSHLLVGAVYGAVLPVLDGSINVLLPGQSTAGSPDAIAFEQYLDTVFGYLRNGF
ncbi:MAG: TetR family transcriptional regulator [Paenibacillaceae bacterium]|jgi:AcrR family transcriptional regulator|nr:TetR family transcriptional regulator [Paenibacillaceae bacterium]